MATLTGDRAVYEVKNRILNRSPENVADSAGNLQGHGAPVGWNKWWGGQQSIDTMADTAANGACMNGLSGKKGTCTTFIGKKDVPDSADSSDHPISGYCGWNNPGDCDKGCPTWEQCARECMKNPRCTGIQYAPNHHNCDIIFGRCDSNDYKRVV